MSRNYPIFNFKKVVCPKKLCMRYCKDTWLVFSGCTVTDSKKTELESSDQEDSASVGKKGRVFSVPYHTWKCVPTAISGGVHISESTWVSFLLTNEFSVGVTEITLLLVSHELTAYFSVLDLFSTQWIMVMLSWPYSLKLRFISIQVLFSIFLECESFLESNSPDALTLCEKNLGDSIDSGYFTVSVYIPLNWKDSTTHIHGFAVHVQCHIQMYFGTLWTVWAPKKLHPKKFL